jgi:hypothetical protein
MRPNQRSYAKRLQVIWVAFARIGSWRLATAGRARIRIADKCARSYRASTLMALRIARETYETAALPLSYVGRTGSIGAAHRHPLPALLGTCTLSSTDEEHSARMADDLADSSTGPAVAHRTAVLMSRRPTDGSVPRSPSPGHQAH